MKHSVIGGLCAVSCLLQWSCSDDPIAGRTEQSDDAIIFTSRIYSGGAKSRSNSNCAYEDFKAEKFADRDLYLVSGVQDGIDASKLAQPDSLANQTVENAPASRGTQITTQTLIDTYLNRPSGEKFYIELYGYKYEAKTSYNGKAVASCNYGDVVADGVTIETVIDRVPLRYSSTTDDGTVVMTCDQTYRWDSYNRNRMSFIGIFPSKNQHCVTDNTRYRMSYDNNVPKMFYQIQNGTDQVDLLCAQYNCAANGSTNNNTVSFSMKHILSGLLFSLGDGFSNCVIKKVQISGIYTAGTYNTATETWDVSAAGNGAKSTLAIDVNSKTSTSDEDNTLFLVTPQTLPEGAKLSITLYNADLDKEEVLEKDITGTWEMGKTITYQLSKNPDITDYYISAEYSTMKYGWDGNPAGDKVASDPVTDLGNIRVKSYKSVTSQSGGTITTNYYAVPYTAVAYDATGTSKTSLVSVGTSTAIASTESDATDNATYSADDNDYAFELQKYNYKIKATMGEQTNTTEGTSVDNEAIQSTKSIVFGTKTDDINQRIDLSMYKQKYSTVSNGKATAVRWWESASGGDTRNTSNCYMIRYPGYYTLPCCFGNGIYKDNQDTETFNLGTTITTGNSGSCMNRLKNYNNVAINASWINKGCLLDVTDDYQNPASATLVWQDAPSIISGVKLITRSANGEYYVNFNIEPGTIQPGNAVIAIKNSKGVVIWSWHIWITPYAANDVYAIDTNKLSSLGKRNFLKVPLGYVENKTKVWPERKYVLRLTQDEGSSSGNKSVDVTLWQEKHELPRVSCCYYQWGRKDPFPGWVADETSGKMNYDGSYEITKTRRTCYNESNGVVEWTLKTNTNSKVGDGIQNPFTYYVYHQYSDGRYSNRFPDDNNYYDLWGTLNDYSDADDTKNPLKFDITIGQKSRKTIYDPCPPGFKIPPVYSMPAITWMGGNEGSYKNDWVTAPVADEKELYARVNTPFTSHTDFVNSLGYTFYCNKMLSAGGKDSGGGTYTLRAFGNIATDASITGYGQNVRYWTASCWVSSYMTGTTNHRMVSMYIAYSGNDSQFVPVFGNTESYGCPVFAVVDTDKPTY